MRFVRAVAATVVMGLMGWLIPVLALDEGVDRFTGEEQEVARTAVLVSRLFVDHPLERLVYIRGRVVDVAHVPGHCPAYSGADVLRDYTATVRYHTFFALPVETIYATCGGDAVSRTPLLPP